MRGLVSPQSALKRTLVEQVLAEPGQAGRPARFRLLREHSQFQGTRQGGMEMTVGQQLPKKLAVLVRDSRRNRKFGYG
jgi:hypothetical protein